VQDVAMAKKCLPSDFQYRKKTDLECPETPGASAANSICSENLYSSGQLDGKIESVRHNPSIDRSRAYCSLITYLSTSSPLM
jgi:hypothetical protein